MPGMKLVKNLEQGDYFVYNGITYLVHATFRQGPADTDMVVTMTNPNYDRRPKDLTLNNLTAVETI